MAVGVEGRGIQVQSSDNAVSLAGRGGLTLNASWQALSFSRGGGGLDPPLDPRMGHEHRA